MTSARRLISLWTRSSGFVDEIWAMEEALYETTILRQFAGLSVERIPDETTILNFRRLLEKHVGTGDGCARFTQRQSGAATPSGTVACPLTPDWGMRREIMSRSFTTRFDQSWEVGCK